MNIELKWREDCGHCRGSGTCDNTYKKDCYYGCKTVVSITWNKAKTKSKQTNHCGQCIACKGNGWILTELGESFQSYMDWYVENLLSSRIASIADDRIYNDRRID